MQDHPSVCLSSDQQVKPCKLVQINVVNIVDHLRRNVSKLAGWSIVWSIDRVDRVDWKFLISFFYILENPSLHFHDLLIHGGRWCI